MADIDHADGENAQRGGRRVRAPTRRCDAADGEKELVVVAGGACVVADPPWPSRSAARRGAYDTAQARGAPFLIYENEPGLHVVARVGSDRLRAAGSDCAPGVGRAARRPRGTGSRRSRRGGRAAADEHAERKPRDPLVGVVNAAGAVDEVVDRRWLRRVPVGAPSQACPGRIRRSRVGARALRAAPPFRGLELADVSRWSRGTRRCYRIANFPVSSRTPPPVALAVGEPEPRRPGALRRFSALARAAPWAPQIRARHQKLAPLARWPSGGSSRPPGHGGGQGRDRGRRRRLAGLEERASSCGVPRDDDSPSATRCTSSSASPSAAQHVTLGRGSQANGQRGGPPRRRPSSSPLATRSSPSPSPSSAAQLGTEGEPPFGRTMGEGFVVAHDGDYADALRRGAAWRSSTRRATFPPPPPASSTPRTGRSRGARRRRAAPAAAADGFAWSSVVSLGVCVLPVLRYGGD